MKVRPVGAPALTGRDMNLQGISEISFDETHDRPRGEHLPRSGPPGWLGPLVALIEATCVRELRCHLEDTSTPIVASRVQLDHRWTVAPTEQVRLRGWSCQVGEHCATFAVQVLLEDGRTLCDGAFTLWTEDARETPAAARSIDSCWIPRAGSAMPAAT